MTLTILTLFPEYFTSPLLSSVVGKAITNHKLKINLLNIRDFTLDKHHVTDDRPYGGGPGMVMKIEPIYAALESLNLVNADGLLPAQQRLGTKVILLSAKGQLFTQQQAKQWQVLHHLVLICGHYEGVDERVAMYLVDAELRIGDYVLTGGEPAALVVADALARLQPGVLGNQHSTVDESHGEPGALGFPQFTRPAVFQNWNVPEVLLTGHHQDIAAWRQGQKQTSSD